MIYVPDTENYKCFVVRSESVIRAYKEIPSNNADIDYRDYYYNSNYLYTDGTQSFSNYTTIPTCLDSSVVTDNVYYRTDLDSILIVFTILCIFGLLIPLKVFMRLFRRFN